MITPTQRKILRELKRQGASHKIRKAAIEANIVEASGGNPSGGDRDSVGAYQIRVGIHKGVNASSVRDSTKWFIKNAKQADRPGLSSGALAQAVERSAYPGRYAQHSKEAERIQRRGGSAKPAKTSRSVTIPGQDNSVERNQAILNYIQNRDRPDSLLQLAQGLKDTKSTPDRKVTIPGRREPKTSGDESNLAATTAKKGSFPLTLSTGGTAQRDFQDLAKHGTVKVPITGQRITPNKRMVAFANDLARHGVPINAFVGGKHSSGSQHYKGQALDAPPNNKTAMRLARKHGVKVFHEDSAHDHYHV